MVQPGAAPGSLAAGNAGKGSARGRRPGVTRLCQVEDTSRLELWATGRLSPLPLRLAPTRRPAFDFQWALPTWFRGTAALSWGCGRTQAYRRSNSAARAAGKESAEAPEVSLVWWGLYPSQEPQDTPFGR